MNWMTSGKHRALYSQRGRRRQMHFPSQVQSQRVKPTGAAKSSQPERARDSATPWYIVSMGDDDESQDIRVLELERKGAMSSAELEAERKAETKRAGGGESAQKSPTQKRSCQQQEQEAQDGRSESRCIFTPVKKARKYDQVPGAVQRVKSVREERPPSSIASGVDMLFFNDGEELPHKNRARSLSRVLPESAPSNDRHSRFSQRTSGNVDQAAPELQPQSYYQNEDVQLRQIEAQQFLSDGESFHGINEFPDATGNADQQGYHLWRVNSNSHAGSSPDTTFSRPEAPLFRSGDDSIHESSYDTPPSSPFAASPLSFRMSRAEVLQSQLPSKVPDVNPSGAQLSLFGSPHASPSPSTSTSSESSIVLGRPPLGWQTKMMSSLNEDRIDILDQSLSSLSVPPGPPSPTFTFDSAPASGHQPLNPQDQPLKSSLSTRSSSGSDGESSIIDAVVPIDAKERIMAAANSQQLPEDSRVWFQRPAVLIPTSNSNSTTGSLHSAKSMALQQQSWVMSSRTKTIFDAVSASKVSTSHSLVEKRDTKYQEMESVAIYMYTLVQCYKIEQEATSVSTDAVVTKPAACRREIVFSPKRK